MQDHTLYVCCCIRAHRKPLAPKSTTPADDSAVVVGSCRRAEVARDQDPGSAGPPVLAMPSGLNDRCVLFGVVRPCAPLLPSVATDLNGRGWSFGHTNGHFTLRTMAERQGFEPWDLLSLRFSRAHRSGRGGPSAFDLSVNASDLAPLRPPVFAGEDASEAAAHCWLQDHLGGATVVAADTTRVKVRARGNADLSQLAIAYGDQASIARCQQWTHRAESDCEDHRYGERAHRQDNQPAPKPDLLARRPDPGQRP